MLRSYLFVTWEGGGNVSPVLGVARRLAARGHKIRVLSEPALRPAVVKAGGEFIPFSRHFVRERMGEDLIGDWQGKSPIDGLKRVLDNVLLGPARIVAEETLWAIEQVRPDVVVVDALMAGALIAAEKVAIPRVVLYHMPEYLPGPGRPAPGPGFLPRTDWIGRLRDGVVTSLFYRTLNGYLPAFNDTRRAFGLSPLASAEELMGQYHQADRRLIQTTRAFDFPIEPPPANVRYVGPVLDDPDWVQPWQNPWPANDRRPLVVAGLSSTFQNQRDLWQRIITALGALDVRGFVTLGPAMAAEAFDLPPNVVTVVSAPHSQVFPHSAAVITHAGHGTVIRALANGLPLVCLPMGRDQDDNAARVFYHGAGQRLKPSAKPEQISRALREVLAEPRFRENAARLGRLITADVAAERAVAELEAVGLGYKAKAPVAEEVVRLSPQSLPA